MHPKFPINIGEDFMKGIYEALRSSPQESDLIHYHLGRV